MSLGEKEEHPNEHTREQKDSLAVNFYSSMAAPAPPRQPHLDSRPAVFQSPPLNINNISNRYLANVIPDKFLATVRRNERSELDSVWSALFTLYVR